MCLPGTAETVRRRVEEEGLPRLDRRGLILAGAGAALAASLPRRAVASTIPANRRQDLTHVYSEEFPLFLGAPIPTTREVVVTVPTDGFYAQKWSFWEHSGTHMDMPAHFIADGRQSPELTTDEMIAPAVVVDIAARAASDPDAAVSLDDVRMFEKRHGRIPRGAVVCMHSGWASRAGSVEDYRNVGPDGLQHFPGFGKEAIEWLVAERDIRGIGVDTMSLDPGNVVTFDAHYTVLGADRYGIENLVNLERIPARGATLFVGLIPWRFGSGGPARVVAAW